MKRFLPLLIFVLLSFLGLGFYSIWGSSSLIWRIWSALDVSFAVALGVLALIAYWEMLRDEDEIALCFDVEGQVVDTGLSLLRKDCTRGEVIGVLGMMQRKTKERFHYDAKHLKDLLQALNRVQRGSEKRLLIPIDKEEFEQFALDASKPTN